MGTLWKVEQTQTGIALWEGEADSEQDALDKMAQGAGYRDYAHACEDASSDGVIAFKVGPSHALPHL